MLASWWERKDVIKKIISGDSQAVSLMRKNNITHFLVDYDVRYEGWSCIFFPKLVLIL